MASVTFNSGSTPNFGQGITAPDLINSLPTDKSDVNKDELKLVNSLFQKEQTTVEKVLNESKDVFIVGFLFVLFSLPYLEPVIIKIYPNAGNSPYVMLGIKCLLVMTCYFLLKNLYLVRK